MRFIQNLGSALAAMLCMLVPRAPSRPRVIRFRLDPFVKRGHAKVLAGGRSLGLLMRQLVPAMLVMCLLVAGAAALVALNPDVANAFLVADAALLTRKKDDLGKILKEAGELQEKYSGKKWESADRTKFETLCVEGEAIQQEVADLERVEKLNGVKGRIDAHLSEIPDKTPLPDSKSGDKERPNKNIAGFITLGQAVVQSAGLKRFLELGSPDGPFSLYRAAAGSRESKHGRAILVPLTKEQRQEFESKAAPTLSADVIEPERIAEVVRVTEQDQLMLRDVMNVSQTTRDAVTYRRIASYTRAAAAVAQGAAKPEATMSIDTVTATVRTQAVWMPVHNNQLADAPDLRNMIDNELLYDLRKYEEEQVIYGDNTGEEFEGIVTNASVQAARTVTGDTLIDVIRRAITDIRRDGYAPNAVAIDPIDWEEIELEKGTDERYVWAVIRDALGPRIWGLRVVETVGAEANEGNPTERRNIVVADWVRGSTLWVRETPSVNVGWIANQFIENMRTLLAEQRAAFGVKRPNAFRKHETQAAVT